MASNLREAAPNLRANYIRPSLPFIILFLFLIAMASNLRAMAPNLRANYSRPTCSFVFVSNSDGLQPKSDGPQPKSKL